LDAREHTFFVYAYNFKSFSAGRQALVEIKISQIVVDGGKK
jgi:hypothetical protein